MVVTFVVWPKLSKFVVGAALLSLKMPVTLLELLTLIPSGVDRMDEWRALWATSARFHFSATKIWVTVQEVRQLS
jgi:hypothetical protein